MRACDIVNAYIDLNGLLNFCRLSIFEFYIWIILSRSICKCKNFNIFPSVNIILVLMYSCHAISFDITWKKLSCDVEFVNLVKMCVVVIDGG